MTVLYRWPCSVDADFKLAAVAAAIASRKVAAALEALRVIGDGGALREFMLNERWLYRELDSRALRVTELGEQCLRASRANPWYASTWMALPRARRLFSRP